MNGILEGLLIALAMLIASFIIAGLLERCCRPDTDWYGQSDIETGEFRNPNIPLVVNGVIVTYRD